MGVDGENHKRWGVKMWEGEEGRRLLNMKTFSPTRELGSIYHRGLQVCSFVCRLVPPSSWFTPMREKGLQINNRKTAYFSLPFFVLFMCVCGTPSRERIAISNTINNDGARRRKGLPRLCIGQCDIRTMVGLELTRLLRPFINESVDAFFVLMGNGQ